MRIAWLSVSDQLGGSEVALVAMIRGLRAARPSWQFLVVLPGDGPLRARVEEAGAATAIVPLPAILARLGESAAMSRGWSAAATLSLGLRLGAGAAALPAYERALRRTLAAFEPDVIQTNGLKAHVLGARARLPRTALVWHLHEYVARRRLTRLLMRRYARRCTAAIANSASVAADFSSIVDVPPPIHVVHNAVDLEACSPGGSRVDLDALAGLEPAPAGSVRVGLVATFGRWKGHEVFLHALQRLASTAEPVRGYIVGGPLYDTTGSQYGRAELEAMIDRLGLRGRAGLTGFLEPASAMRALDIVVHASTEPEPFGLVIAEAMACGRPVITTAYGGSAELIEAGRDALIAGPGDAEALADAIRRLAGDPALRASLGARARIAALERFAPERMAAGLAAVFEQVAPRHPLAQSA